MRIIKDEPPLQTKALRLTRKWYKTLINTYDVVCICFYCEWYPGNGRGNYREQYDKAANIIANLYPRERHQKGKAIMVKVNCSDEKVLAKMFNIGYYPFYQIIKNGELMETKYPKWRSTEYFLQLIEEFIEDKKSRLPEPDRSILPFGIYTEKLTLENYKKFVREREIVMIFFYASWYESCREALQLYEKANGEICNLYRPKYYTANSIQTVAMARMEAGRNAAVIKKFRIKQYPTFKLFNNGSMHGEYKWDGKHEGFVNVLRELKEKNQIEQEKKRKNLSEDDST